MNCWSIKLLNVLAVMLVSHGAHLSTDRRAYGENSKIIRLLNKEQGDKHMEHLRCVVERITYQNEENGYTVLKCAVKTIVTW